MLLFQLQGNRRQFLYPAINNGWPSGKRRQCREFSQTSTFNCPNLLPAFHQLQVPPKLLVQLIQIDQIVLATNCLEASLTVTQQNHSQQLSLARLVCRSQRHIRGRFSEGSLNRDR